MYTSRISLFTNRNLSYLKKDLLVFLKTSQYVHVKSMKNRKVFFDKLPEVLFSRKKTVKKRLQSFFVAIDILRHEKKFTVHSQNNKEFSIIGKSFDNTFVEIHIREEIIQGDRKLLFISCFPKEKITQFNEI